MSVCLINNGKEGEQQRGNSELGKHETSKLVVHNIPNYEYFAKIKFYCNRRRNHMKSNFVP